MHVSVASVQYNTSSRRSRPIRHGSADMSTRAMPRRVQALFVVIRFIVGLTLASAAVTALLTLMAILAWLFGAT